MEPLIFIVASHIDKPIADALKRLLDFWGKSMGDQAEQFAFSSSLSPADFQFKRALRQKLSTAPIAVILLSREFQWCQFGQAETGAALTMGKAILPVTIPPVSEKQEVERICEILDKTEFTHLQTNPLDHPQFFAEFRKNVAQKCLEALKVEKNPSTKSRLEAAKKFLELPKGNNDEEEPYRIELHGAYERMRDYYTFRPAERVLQSKWDSIEQARDCIIHKIKESLGNDSPRSTLILVGVSLKFSMEYVQDALRQFAEEVKQGKWKARAEKKPKQLDVELVYMNDNSHLLHAVLYTAEIKRIRDRFRANFPSTEANWRQICVGSHIHLSNIQRNVIDFIPPSVGVLIDCDTLFAGQCSLTQKVRTNTSEPPTFELRVGENPYFFHTKSDKGDTHGQRLIQGFRQDYLNAYQHSDHNGVVLVKKFGTPSASAEEDSSEWIAKLRECLDFYHGISRVVLLSESGSKFLPLINKIAQKNELKRAHHQPEINLEVFVRQPASLGGVAKARFQTVIKTIRSTLSASCVEVFYYDKPLGFRLVHLSQDAQEYGNPRRTENGVIGFEMYKPYEDADYPRGFLPLIVPQNSHRFDAFVELIESIRKHSAKCELTS